MTYQIDAQHTTVQFKVRHLMIANVRGVFGKVSGSVDYDEANPTASTVEVAIETGSVATPDPARDAHLKGPDFFDVEKHPAITFKSKNVSKSGSGLSVLGDLSLRGVTKPVTFAVSVPTGETKDPWGNMRRGLEATASISRKDFGLTWNATIESGGVMVSDQVDLIIDAELVRKV
jgi:polyisoprenoid-binding protein YceI